MLGVLFHQASRYKPRERQRNPIFFFSMVKEWHLLDFITCLVHDLIGLEVCGCRVKDNRFELRDGQNKEKHDL
jgi:hypothetical protein